MRLLYILRTFPKLSETFVLNEVIGQLERGHRVRVISISPGEATDPVSYARVRQLTQVLSRVPSRAFPSPRDLRLVDDKLVRKLYCGVASRAVLRKLKGFRPDIVHAHFINTPALLAEAVARLLGVPHTIMCHAEDYLLGMSPHVLAHRIMESSTTFVVSHAAIDQIAGITGLDRDLLQSKLRVVRAATRLTLEQTPPPLEGHPFTIISVGRLVPQKGIEHALLAFRTLLSHMPEARYWVVGEGPLRHQLEERARALEVAHAVTFYGALPNARAQALIAEADLALLPCQHVPDGNMDGIPVFLMEAGALGLPVVSTAVSGVPELVINGETGLLLDPHDDAGLAAALLKLSKHPDERHRMGEALKSRVSSEFSLNVQLDRLEATWNSLLQSTSPAHDGAGSS